MTNEARVCLCSQPPRHDEYHSVPCDLFGTDHPPVEGRTLTPCEACTGDGGRGHTLRGECMGAPCEDCGEARYLHLPDQCPSTKVRPRDA